MSEIATSNSIAHGTAESVAPIKLQHKIKRVNALADVEGHHVRPQKDHTFLSYMRFILEILVRFGFLAHSPSIYTILYPPLNTLPDKTLALKVF